MCGCVGVETQWWTGWPGAVLAVPACRTERCAPASLKLHRCAGWRLRGQLGPLYLAVQLREALQREAPAVERRRKRDVALQRVNLQADP
jgi:hypothetical protein